MSQTKKSKANNSSKYSKNKKKGQVKASDLRFRLGGVSSVVNFDRLIEHLKVTTSKSSKSPNLYLIFKEKEWDADNDKEKPTLKVSSNDKNEERI